MKKSRKKLLTYSTRTRYNDRMRNRPWAMSMGALLALALMALSAAPHFHADSASASHDCVLCHVDDNPVVATTASTASAETITSSEEVDPNDDYRHIVLTGHSSRAPPA